MMIEILENDTMTATLPAMMSPARARPASRLALTAIDSTLLRRFRPIGLEGMGATALMSRVDSKFIVPLAQVAPALTEMVAHYDVLEVEGTRLNRYRTLYYDTRDLALYLSHHRGQLERYKVRSREYVDSGLSFLEVKCKTNKGRTIKQRHPATGLAPRLSAESERFIAAMIPTIHRPLSAALWNQYYRITLVSRTQPERVTLDLDLQCWFGDQIVSLGHVGVLEVKQERYGQPSAMLSRLRAMGIRQTAFSKYCVGTALLRPQVRQNRFKPIIRQLQGVGEGISHA